jgi:hypothetical protein
MDGELMLLHQGAAAFTLWTGKPAPLELMQLKLQEARAAGLLSAEGEPAGAGGPATPGSGSSGPVAAGGGTAVAERADPSTDSPAGEPGSTD